MGGYGRRSAAVSTGGCVIRMQRAYAACANRFDRRLAAKSAARRGGKIPPGAVLVQLNSRGEVHVDHVFAVAFSVSVAVPNRNNIFRAANDALGEAQSSGKFQIIARGAHGHSQKRSLAQADFEWFLGGGRILATDHASLGPFRDAAGRESFGSPQHFPGPPRVCQSFPPVSAPSQFPRSCCNRERRWGRGHRKGSSN